MTTQLVSLLITHYRSDAYQLDSTITQRSLHTETVSTRRSHGHAWLLPLIRPSDSIVPVLVFSLSQNYSVLRTSSGNRSPIGGLVTNNTATIYAIPVPPFQLCIAP